MKTLALLFGVLLLLVSCASLPLPNTPSDALVIGFFSLYFPGGYFDSPQDTVERGVELDFRDLTTGSWFCTFTIGGAFKFLAHGNDTYTLIDSRASLLDGSRRYVIGPRAVGLEISPSPGSVLYLGNIELTYTRPTNMFMRYPEVDYEIRGEGGMSLSSAPGGGGGVLKWDYDATLSQKWDEPGLRDYMRRIDPNSPWLSRDVVDVKLKTPSASALPAQ